MPGENTIEDLKKEALLLEQREGIKERRVNGNGKSWDTFWKVLSIMVIPWATGVMFLLLSLSKDVIEVKTHYLDMERRLTSIEKDIAGELKDPTKRFYRWDGQALESRIIELEELHPRQVEP